MSKLSILHLPTWYPNQDDLQLGIFIENQIELLSEDCNHIVLYLQSRKGSEMIETSVTVQKNITKIHVTSPSGKNIFSKTRNFLNSVTIGLSKLIELNKKIDLTHCHVAGKNLWIAQKYFKETPCLLSEHWSGFLNGNFELQSKWKQKLMIKRINNCKKVIAVSEHLKLALKAKKVTTEIEVIGNLIVQPNRKDQLNNEVTKLLLVNDLVDEIKNISGVITALNNIVNHLPNLTLTIIGDGQDKEKINKLIDELNLSNKVILKGRLTQDKVLQEYKNYDALIVNSFTETFSMVTLEALSSGIPVISTKCKGPEKFINKINGLLIPINDSNALSKAILELNSTYTNYDSDNIIDSIKQFTETKSIRQSILNNYNTLVNKN